MSFTENLIGMLGTKHEAFGFWDAAIIVAAIGLFVGVQLVLAGVINRADSVRPNAPVVRR